MLIISICLLLLLLFINLLKMLSGDVVLMERLLRTLQATQTKLDHVSLKLLLGVKPEEEVLWHILLTILRPFLDIFDVCSRPESKMKNTKQK